MKKHFRIVLMAVAAIAITSFTACKKGGDVPSPDEPRPAVLKVSLVTPAPDTRVAGDAPSTATTIKDFSLFVIDGSGDVGWSKYFSGTEAQSGVGYIEVTTDAKSIYAIANAGSDLTSVYRTKAALEGTGALVETLSSQYTSRWATGSVDGSTWEFQQNNSNPDDNTLLEENVPIALKFIAARIVVTVDNNMTGYATGTPSTVQIANVAVLNARGQSRLFPGTGTSLIPDTYSPAASKNMEGLANNSFQYYPNAEDFTLDTADDRLVSPYTYNGASTPQIFHFYVFENDSDELVTGEFPTIVTLVGTDADGGAVYFPVHFAAYETWANNTSGYTGGIKRGNSYNVTITLNGDATQGNGGGTDDPTVNVENVEIVATLTITPWVDIKLGKNF